MRFLIDTHVLLWFLEGDARLSKNVRSLITTSENEIWLSIASLWEIAVTTEEPEALSFLEMAEALAFDGPPDWSVQLDEYLYGYYICHREIILAYAN